MDCNHADTPRTELLIADLLAEHKNCPVKGHLLVVTDDKRILLKHRKELCASNIIIAVSETNNAGDITSTLFQ